MGGAQGPTFDPGGHQEEDPTKHLCHGTRLTRNERMAVERSKNNQYVTQIYVLTIPDTNSIPFGDTLARISLSLLAWTCTTMYILFR
ncbi:hypothetical protein L204_103753 [Cryptococcus depauperatus]